MSNVTVGLSTKVGFAAAAAAAIIPLIGELANATEPIGVPPSVWVVLSALLTSVTVIGRMWQAATQQEPPAPEPD